MMVFAPNNRIRTDKIPTETLCPLCLRSVNGLIEIVGDDVIINRECPNHGRFTSLLFDNIDYFKNVCNTMERIENIKYSTIILELLENCNIRCNTCVASSSQDLTLVKSYETICNNIKNISSLASPPSSLMLSGGEPTLHPHLLDIIAFAHDCKFEHIFLITNGILLAENKELVKNLSFFQKLEVYLQFDALDSEALLNIRGADLRNTRTQAVENLHKYNVPTTLVCVLKKKVNDFLISQIIDYALSYPNIRGITFQPIRFLGRVDGSDYSTHNLSITEVIRKIHSHLDEIGFEMLPHPLSPGSMAIGCFDRLKKHNITQNVLDSLNNSFLFPYPNFHTKNFTYNDIFRIIVFAYHDRYTYTDFLSQQCAIAFWSNNNTIEPIDRYYLK